MYEDGTTTEPFGPGAEGLLLYAADGWMSACIMAAGPRATVARQSAGGARRSSAPPLSMATSATAGRWRILDRRVQHEVTVALNPAMVGTLQLRDAQTGGAAH